MNPFQTGGLFARPRLLSRRRSAEPNILSRKETEKGAKGAYETTEYDAYSSTRSHDQDKRPQRVKSVPRHLNRKSGPSSSQPELERGAKRETDRQDPNTKLSL